MKKKKQWKLALLSWLFFFTLPATTSATSSFSFQECYRILQRITLLKGAEEYRSLFSPDSRNGTCGPTCLIDLSSAAELAEGKEIGSPIEKMKILQRIVSTRYQRGADEGLLATELIPVAKEFFPAIGIENLNVTEYPMINPKPGFVPKQNTVEILSALTQNQIAMVAVGAHWVTVTDFNPTTNEVTFKDTNFRGNSNRPFSFQIQSKPIGGRNYEYASPELFKKLYHDKWQVLTGGRDELYLGSVIVAERMEKSSPVVGRKIKSEVLTTKEVEDMSYKDLPGYEMLAAAQLFEQQGGMGKWVLAPHLLPNVAENGVVVMGKQANALYYQIESTSPNQNPRSPLQLSRLAHTNRELNEALQEGVPVFLGSLPAGSATAFVAGREFPTVQKLLESTGSNKKHALVIQPTATEFVFHHEKQHWKDFENEQFGKELKTEITKLADIESLKPNLGWLYTFVWELRAHAAQEGLAIRNGKQNLPTLNRIGMPTDSSQCRFEAMDAKNVFTQTYSVVMLQILTEVKQKDPKQLSRLIAFLKRYDRPDPDSTLSFQDSVLRYLESRTSNESEGF